MMTNKNSKSIVIPELGPASSNSNDPAVKPAKCFLRVLKSIENWGLNVIKKDISIALFYLYF
ncbi:hypothetical protein ACYATP_07340 [Lactobacillaceae bacterium Melli_B4]